MVIAGEILLGRDLRTQYRALLRVSHTPAAERFVVRPFSGLDKDEQRRYIIRMNSNPNARMTTGCKAAGKIGPIRNFITG